jgi:hypothetical protein
MLSRDPNKEAPVHRRRPTRLMTSGYTRNAPRYAGTYCNPNRWPSRISRSQSMVVLRLSSSEPTSSTAARAEKRRLLEDLVRKMHRLPEV